MAGLQNVGPVVTNRPHAASTTAVVGQSAPPFDGRPRNAEPLGGNVRRQSCDALKSFDWRPDLRSTEALAFRRGPSQPGEHAFSDALPLELRDGPEDVHLQLARRRRRVAAVGKTESCLRTDETVMGGAAEGAGESKEEPRSSLFRWLEALQLFAPVQDDGRRQ